MKIKMTIYEYFRNNPAHNAMGTLHDHESALQSPDLSGADGQRLHYVIMSLIFLLSAALRGIAAQLLPPRRT